jgi:hypothetical protein
MAGRIGSVPIAAAVPSKAAEVKSDRLVNADKEPGNWLMNHRTYDAQRYSPLDKINKTNVKGLKLASAGVRSPRATATVIAAIALLASPAETNSGVTGIATAFP